MTLARCAAAIFLRADADIVRFAGAEAATDCDAFRRLAHLARCASAILRRDAPDIVRVDGVALWGAATPFNDSIPEII